MMNKNCLPLALLLFLAACNVSSVENVYSENKDEIKAHNLINNKEAYAMLSEKHSSYLPIQVSKKEAFIKEHIPKAQNIWRPDYGSAQKEPYGGLIPSAQKLEVLLQNLNYQKGKTLLLYDTKANVDALRFGWVLNLYGFNDFKIINGGLKYWKLNGLETNKDIVQAQKSDFRLAAKFDDSIIAQFDEVMSAINDSNTILIDTREAYEYNGEPFKAKNQILSHKKGAFTRGSIPSAIHLNWSTLADLNGDHRIKSEKDLKFDLYEKGIKLDKKIILYCQSGSRTSHTYYVLKHVLGYKNVKNYDGSWIEWSYKNSQDPSVPIQQICGEQKHQTMLDSLNNL